MFKLWIQIGPPAPERFDIGIMFSVRYDFSATLEMIVCLVAMEPIRWMAESAAIRSLEEQALTTLL